MDYASKIQEAKASGYSDDDIATYLGSSDTKVKEALDSGHSGADIVKYLSGQPATPAEAPAVTPYVPEASAQAPISVGTTSVPQPVEGVVTPTEGNVTAPTSLGVGIGDAVASPQYKTEAEFASLATAAPRTDIGAEMATYTDPKTGATITESTAKPLEDTSLDIALALPVGKLAALNYGGKDLTIMSNSLKADTSGTALYDYVKSMHNITDKESDTIFSGWNKIMDAPDTPINRTKALVDSMGAKGAQLKREAAAGSPEATRVIEGEVKARINEVKSLVDTAASVEGTAVDIAHASKVVKANYADVKNMLGAKPVTVTTKIPEIVDEATAGTVSEIRTLLADNTSGSIIDAIPLVNKMIKKSEGKSYAKWNQVKSELDSTLQKNLTPREYDLWSTVNSDYAKMSNVMGSKVGNIMQRVLSNTKKGAKLTPKAAIEEIAKLKPADDLFNDMAFLVGKPTAAQFEKQIIGEALNGTNNVSWAQLAKNVNRKGFVSEEGKNLTKVINDLSTSFATDDVLKSIAFKQQGVEAGISDDLLAKARFAMVGKIFKVLTKHIPFSDTARHMRMTDELSKVLSNPTKVKNLMEEFNNLGEGVKRVALEDTVKEAYILTEPASTVK